MNEGAVLIAIFCVFACPLIFGLGYVVGRAGGFRKMFEFPELPELLQYDNWDALDEQQERFEQQRERVEQRLEEAREGMTP